MSWSPNRHNDDDEATDSLFGSPPPSPGRSPSPGLALPGSTANTSGNVVSALTKNVGTIALPGSQPSSECLNPLASSLSVPTSSTRHPLATSRASNSPSSSLPPTPSTTTSALPQNAGPRPPRVRKRKMSSRAATPRQEVQIPLPDPSEPIPPNFLRSQTALLGAAGLVAGVNPANLVHRARGTTPSNPIVIEEEVAQRKAPTPAPRPQPPPPPPQAKKPVERHTDAIQECLEKPGLTMPSKQDILAFLVKEKDVFPIIQSLIKLTAPGAPRPNQSNTSSRADEEGDKRAPRTKVVGTHATGYPMKKRKLNRVPAGAADWDIPYPFDSGEGPTEYHATWQDERAKQLIEQLINLIKNATKKAAMHNYLKGTSHHGVRTSKGKSKASSTHQNREDEPRVNKYYKAITATYGLPPSTASSRQTTPANDSSRNRSRSGTPSTAPGPSSSSVATTPGPDRSQEANSLDLLLSSLLGMSSSNQPTQSAATPGSSGSSNEAGCDQSWLDDWLKTFNPSTDMNSDGSFAQPVVGTSTSTPGASSSTNAAFDFSDFDVPNAGPPGMQSSTDPLCASNDPFPIDPELLALSTAPASGPQTAQAPSPMQSLTSSSETDPLTPLSADWDMTMFDIFTPVLTGDALSNDAPGLPSMSATSGTDSIWDSVVGKEASTLDVAASSRENAWDDECVPAMLPQLNLPIPSASTTTPTPEVLVEMGPAEKSDPGPLSNPSLSPLKLPMPPSLETETTSATVESQARDPSNPPPKVPSERLAAPLPGPVPNHAEASSAPPPPKPSLTSEKEDLIKRAKERKVMLEVELNKVKLQLWEATIEHGALHHVVGHYQEKDRMQKAMIAVPVDDS